MVNAVSGSTYNSYLTQLQGTNATSSQSTSQNVIASLLSKPNASTSSVVSLIQPDSTGNFNPISSLFGSSGINDGITKLYSNLYASVAASSLTQAQSSGNQQAQSQNNGGNPVSSLISQLTQASVAYNKTLQQNAAAAVAASAKATHGVTSIVS